jgi:hypothetical protein
VCVCVCVCACVRVVTFLTHQIERDLSLSTLRNTRFHRVLNPPHANRATQPYSLAGVKVDAVKLSEFYGREVVVADREMVEQGADEFLDRAKHEDVALLVVGR